jgi:hypothetical protein
MDKETLHFKIGLSGSSSKKDPEFSIAINGKEYVQSTLSGEIEYFEFDCELIEDAEYKLEISLLNKLPIDTIKDADDNITEDMLLSIKSIDIDDINLGPLIWTNSIYYPKYPDCYQNEEQKKISKVKNCVDLGWNGTWTLSFTSPFYVWLLENI